MDESEVLRFEQQKQITKLSQAIREGAKLRPQCKFKLFHKGGSCVWGAAAEAQGVLPYTENANLSSLPYDFEVKRQEAESAYRLAYLRNAYEQNDIDGLSREAIADKLEALGY